MVNQQKFAENYDSLAVYNRNEPPMVHFPSKIAGYFAGLSALRMKPWPSSKRVNPMADAIGLICEVSFHRWQGLSAEEALSDFEQGLKGDAGVDSVVNGVTFDVKGTGAKSGPIRFTFTRTNRHDGTAEAYAWVRLMETQDGGVNGYLLGWSYSSQVRRFRRDSARYPHIQHVYLETLKRNNVLHPINHLLLAI